MSGYRVLKIVQAVLCVALAVLLCAGTVGILREGSARRAEDPLEPIFTREAVVKMAAPLAPLFCAIVVLTAAGPLLGGKAKGDVRAARAPGRLAPAVPAEAAPKRLTALRAALVLAALAFILLGIFNGSARDVLYKAANICTECIGLG